MRGRTGTIVVAVAVIASGLIAWRVIGGGEEAAIRRQLAALVDKVNSPTGEGLGAVAHAADIGGYFTDGVVIELGPGTTAIEGRAMLVGMAARLQPRLAVYRLALDDVTIELAENETAANVRLTASFTHRNPDSGQDSMDARELALVMTSDGGTWRIARITPIDTLR